MAALLDADLRIVAELRRAEVQRGGAFGEGGEQRPVRRWRRRCVAVADERRELVQQLFVEELLARQCAVVGGECLVLEGFQFRRDVGARRSLASGGGGSRPAPWKRWRS